MDRKSICMMLLSKLTHWKGNFKDGCVDLPLNIEVLSLLSLFLSYIKILCAFLQLLRGIIFVFIIIYERLISGTIGNSSISYLFLSMVTQKCCCMSVTFCFVAILPNQNIRQIFAMMRIIYCYIHYFQIVQKASFVWSYDSGIMCFRPMHFHL